MKIGTDFPFDFCENCDNLEAEMDCDCAIIDSLTYPIKKIWRISVRCKHADTCRKLKIMIEKEKK